jgi:hypothetical protein
MTFRDLFPAGLIAAATGAALAAGQCLPLGDATVLVRTPSSQSALLLAARSGAALVGVPAPGFAVLHGDAARIRAAAGFTSLWQGQAPCSNRQR